MRRGGPGGAAHHRPVEIRIHESLEAVAPAAWDRLGGNEDPFLSHAFLVALERHGCLGADFGWYPRHLAVYDGHDLIGATPLYAKTNSYGEFVFDWSWASAYKRYGLRYYPKLVAAIPYTPIAGRRLLVAPGVDPEPVQAALIDQAIALARDLQCSGMHWLFTDAGDTARLRDRGLTMRMGCQYHWHNNGYRDFEHFVEAFASRKRKKVLRERRRVAEQDVTLRTLHGDELSDALWETVHRFYVDTFEKKAGIPTLSLEFFKEIGRTLGRRVVVVLAVHRGEPVAAAINFRGERALYGRYWGCAQDFHSLHFEACYYQGLDYCIAEGLAAFEPGAQGEHKISRGFLPTPTWSAHWIAEPAFAEVIHDFCRREKQVLEEHCTQLFELSPFREDSVPPSQRPAQAGLT